LSPAIGLDDDYEVRKILTRKVNNFLPLWRLERERASNIFVMRVTSLDEQRAIGARYPTFRSVDERSDGTLLQLSTRVARAQSADRN
jgi:hypothetical protein